MPVAQPEPKQIKASAAPIEYTGEILIDRPPAPHA
jgi:hypothetical protein